MAGGEGAGEVERCGLSVESGEWRAESWDGEGAEFFGEAGGETEMWGGFVGGQA